MYYALHVSQGAIHLVSCVVDLQPLVSTIFERSLPIKIAGRVHLECRDEFQLRFAQWVPQ